MKTKKGRPVTLTPKSEVIHIRGTAEQVAKWKALAFAEGRSLSQWATRKLDAK